VRIKWELPDYYGHLIVNYGNIDFAERIFVHQRNSINRVVRSDHGESGHFHDEVEQVQLLAIVIHKLESYESQL
jgi:hypothetical protein